MDTFGVAFQTVQLLISTIKIVREALGRQKAQAEVLYKASTEAEETKCIVELVKSQTALQGAPALHAILQRVHEIVESLMEHVQSMDKERSALKAFKHQITQGSAEREDLAVIVRQLGRAKQDLTLHIQLVHVGLTMNNQEAIAVNIDLVEEINRVVQSTLGKGLMIASFIHEKLEGGQPLESNGWLQLTPAQYQELQENQVSYDILGAVRNEAISEPKRKERVVVDNFAIESTQINVPITIGKREDDVWADMDSVIIRGNVTKVGSLQANYPMTMEVWREVRRSGSHRSRRPGRR